jgi:predicted lysophospholipase L1 biosynthesis ABC-type transport system permease subunit
MTVSFRTLRHAALAAACITAVATLAPRESFAFSAEAQQMCTGDAFRLCSSDIPNIPAVTACMIKNRSSLTPSCRAVLDREVSKKSGKVADAD